MEAKENELLVKLRSTQSKQLKAYQSLDKIVTVGYSYYQDAQRMSKKKTGHFLPYIQVSSEHLPANYSFDASPKNKTQSYRKRVKASSAIETRDEDI